MPEIIACPQCRKALNIAEAFFGARVQCPACGSVFKADPPYASFYAPSPPPLPPSDGPRRMEEDAPPRSRRECDDAPRRQRRRDFGDRDDDDDRRNIFDIRSDARPHRGSTVLALGIIALVLCWCPIFGWTLGGIATSMAGSDLLQMSIGRMDSEGHGQTQTGKILGTIAIAISSAFAVLGGCLSRLTMR